MPKPVMTGLLITGAIGAAVTMTYRHQIKLFWNEIRDDWRRHEQTLVEYPPTA